MTRIPVTQDELEAIAAENAAPIECPPGKPATVRVGTLLYVAEPTEADDAARDGYERPAVSA